MSLSLSSGKHLSRNPLSRHTLTFHCTCQSLLQGCYSLWKSSEKSSLIPWGILNNTRVPLVRCMLWRQFLGMWAWAYMWVGKCYPSLTAQGCPPGMASEGCAKGRSLNNDICLVDFLHICFSRVNLGRKTASISIIFREHHSISSEHSSGKFWPKS